MNKKGYTIRVSELFYYIRDNIDILQNELLKCESSQVEKEKMQCKLSVLLDIKSICEKRNRY